MGRPYGKVSDFWSIQGRENLEVAEMKECQTCVFTETADLGNRTQNSEEGKGQPRQLNHPSVLPRISRPFLSKRNLQ